MTFLPVWFGSFVIIYVLWIKAAELGAPGPWLEQLNSFFFAFCWISLLLVCLTGLFNFLFDRHGDGGIGKHNWQVKKQMLIVNTRCWVSLLWG